MTIFAILCNQGLVSVHSTEDQALKEASRLLSSFPQVTVVRLCEASRTDLTRPAAVCPA